MIIKRFTIGSDDDDFTIDSLIGCQSIIPHQFPDDPLKTIQTYELTHNLPFTNTLEEFHDEEYWDVAYNKGFRTYMSMQYATNESNEVVYLINMEASI